MKKFFKSLLLLLLVGLNIVNLHSEYIFYNFVDGHRIPLSEDEHAIAYPVINRFQFPMSARCSIDLEEELSPEGFELLCDDERRFIEIKLQETLGPDVRVETITPTLFTVLFCLLFLEPVYQGVTSEEANSYWEKLDEDYESLLPLHLIEIINADFTGNRFMSFHNEHSDDEEYNERIEESFKIITGTAKQNHYETNVAIVLYFERNGLTNSAQIDMRQVLIDINRMWSKIEKSFEKREIDDWRISKQFDIYSRIKLLGRLVQLVPSAATDERSLQIFERMDEIEQEAISTGKFAISRGSGGFERHLDKIFGKRNLSFGNDLFAGCMDSCGGYGRKPACSYMYMNDKTTIGYAILLDKRVFLKKEEDDFYPVKIRLSLLPSNVGLCSEGESFHPRLFRRRNTTEDEFQKLLAQDARIIVNTSGVPNDELLSEYSG